MRVLVVAGSNAAARTDIKALRTLGAREITCLCEAYAVPDFLEKKRGGNDTPSPRQGKIPDTGTAAKATDLMLCDEQAAGLSAPALIHALYMRPGLDVPPHLILTSTTTVAARLRAAGLHALERPCSLYGLRAAVLKAVSPLRRVLRPEDFAALAASGGPTVKKREAAAARKQNDPPATTSDIFNQGLGRLKSGDNAGAEKLFLEVLHRQKEHIGAALGMARICRSGDDDAGKRKWLVRASASCLRNGDMGRMEHIAEMLPRGMRNNVFLHEAVGHMFDGDYREAALSFLDAEKAAEDVPLHRLVARACLMTGCPEESMRRICDAVLKLGHRDKAPALRRRLLEYGPRNAEDDDSRPARFPLLTEALSAASFAVWAWKRA
jgi:hypothetical protein